jgi:class 3 adenylate cyclase
METKRITRKLAAILSADVKDYSRLMRDDEVATVSMLNACKQAMFTLIQQYYGRVVDSPGDNLLAEFNSVIDAVQSAVAIQKELKAQNEKLAENRRMRFRIGINLGDVIVEEGRIYGDGVNIAARLEGLADPGGICISRTAFDQIEDKLPLGYEYMGEKPIKNSPKPVQAYRVILEPDESSREYGDGVSPKLEEKPEDPARIIIERRRRRTNPMQRYFLRHLRPYFFVVLLLLVINLLTNSNRLWFQWVAIPWGALIFIRWLRFHPPSWYRKSSGHAMADKAPQDRTTTGGQKTLVVQVEPKGAGRGKSEKVNIRIPLRMLKAGMKLGAVLPSNARDAIEKTMKEHGMGIDLFSMDRETLSETLKAMGGLRIEVEQDEKTVRIFCE